MAGQLEFDESVVAQLEEIYKTRDVRRRRAAVQAALAPRPGERLLDIGCGPGFYVAELADAVGPEGSVTGIDSSEQSLAVARQRAAGRGNVELLVGDASSLPVPDAGFDGAISVQVMEYVTDVGAALAEIRRALRPAGRVVLWDVDWSTLSVHSEHPERTERVLRGWDEHLADPVLPRRLSHLLRAAGFQDVDVEGHLFVTTRMEPDAYGGSFIPFIAGFTAGRDSVGPDLSAEFAAEQRALDERGEFFFAVVQFCFTATRA